MSTTIGATMRMEGGLVGVENNRDRISAGDSIEFVIRNENPDEVDWAWVDPHVDIDGKYGFDVWGTATLRLDDGSRVAIETMPWGNDPTATRLSKVTNSNGNHGVPITGVDTNTRGDLAVDGGRGWGLVVDAAWQRHGLTIELHTKLSDIPQEMKKAENDLLVKQHWRRAHPEWSWRNARQAARRASMPVLNPTHAAIEYDRRTCPVPTESMVGEGHMACAMREAAD
jgi:hypothetical protein